MIAPFDKFNPATTRFDANNAYGLALCARLAYQDEPAVFTQIQQWGFDPAKFEFLKAGDTQGFVAGNDQMIVISFRGTEANDIWDWMTDADIILRPFDAGMVHQGFYLALDKVWYELNAALNKFRDNAQSLWFTGHSLGAALACMAVAREIFERRTPMNGLYTFGHPRTGDFTFSSRFDHEFGDKTFRFVNDQDIVTRVAPRVLGYSHVGRTLFFDAKGKLQDDDHWWNKFLTEIKVGLEGLEKPAEIVEDHFIARYVANMAKNLKFRLA